MTIRQNRTLMTTTGEKTQSSQLIWAVIGCLQNFKEGNFTSAKGIFLQHLQSIWRWDEEMDYIYFKFLPVFEKNIWWNLLLCSSPADSLLLLIRYPILPIIHMTFPGDANGKGIHLKIQETQENMGSIVGKIPWRRKWQPTPVFLPGEFHR